MNHNKNFGEHNLATDLPHMTISKELREEFENKFADNDRGFSDAVLEYIAEREEKAREEERSKLRKSVERIQNRIGNIHYDGNNLKSAEDYYCISAENWIEIIRLEDGHKMATNDVLALLPQILVEKKL